MSINKMRKTDWTRHSAEPREAGSFPSGNGMVGRSGWTLPEPVRDLPFSYRNEFSGNEGGFRTSGEETRLPIVASVPNFGKSVKRKRSRKSVPSGGNEFARRGRGKRRMGRLVLLGGGVTAGLIVTFSLLAPEKIPWRDWFPQKGGMKSDLAVTTPFEPAVLDSGFSTVSTSDSPISADDSIGAGEWSEKALDEIPIWNSDSEDYFADAPIEERAPVAQSPIDEESDHPSLSEPTFEVAGMTTTETSSDEASLSSENKAERISPDSDSRLDAEMLANIPVYGEEEPVSEEKESRETPTFLASSTDRPMKNEIEYFNPAEIASPIPSLAISETTTPSPTMDEVFGVTEQVARPTMDGDLSSRISEPTDSMEAEPTLTRNPSPTTLSTDPAPPSTAIPSKSVKAPLGRFDGYSAPTTKSCGGWK